MTPDIREKAEKITQAEIVELFGDEMPIEAANLLFNAPDDMTIDEVREKIRALAKDWNTPERRCRAQAERLQRDMLHNTSGLTERDLISKALLEAHKAGRAERLTKAATLACHIEGGCIREKDDGTCNEQGQCSVVLAYEAGRSEGYEIGFMNSGEGWNGEYPFEGRDAKADAHWAARRDEALSKAKSE